MKRLITFARYTALEVVFLAVFIGLLVGFIELATHSGVLGAALVQAISHGLSHA